jgi:very-short-patch-repair endonuclease
MLIIELDGPIHNNQKEEDRRRDLVLQSRNLKIIRLKNEELIDIDTVLDKIVNEFE